MKKVIIGLVIALFFLVPAFFTANVQASYPSTYPTANTNEGYVIDSLMIGDRIYLMETTAIYEYNITTNYIQKIFDLGMSYIITSMLYVNGTLYISAYKLMYVQGYENGSLPANGVANGTGTGDNGIHPIPPHDGYVVTCPLPHNTPFYAANFTVFEISSNMNIVNQVVVNKTLYEGYAVNTIRAMKIVYGDGKIYGYITGFDYNASYYITYLYEFNLIGNASATQKASIVNQTAVDIKYSNSMLYILTKTRDLGTIFQDGVYIYSTSTFTLQHSYVVSDGIHHFSAINVDSNYVYIVGAGKASDQVDWKAELLILDRNLSTMEYTHLYQNMSGFTAMKVVGPYVYAANANVYKIFWESNRIDQKWNTHFYYTYDIRLERTIHISGATSLFVLPYTGKNGTTQVMWGGYFTSSMYATTYTRADDYIYAFFVGTQKPASWTITPDSSGAGIIETTTSIFSNSLIILLLVLLIITVVMTRHVKKHRKRKKWKWI